MRPLRPISAALVATLLAAIARAATPHHAPEVPVDERGIPADVPRAHQRVDAGEPPAAPADTPADPGMVYPPSPDPYPPRLRFEQRTTPAPLPPALFNPDPGADASTPGYVPAPRSPARDPNPTPFFPSDPTLPPPPVEPAPAHPSGPLIAPPRIVFDTDPRTADPAKVTPLASDFPDPLPRRGVRSTDYIPANHGHGWHAPTSYPLAEKGEGYPANTQPAPDRWRDTGFTPWRRYTAGDTNESPFAHPDPELWHWYRQSLLKGDLPIVGQDWFLFLALSSETVFEDRDLPLPSGVSSASPGQFDFLGTYGTTVFVQNVALDVIFLNGETVYIPPNHTFRLRLVANYNQVDIDTPGILDPDPGDPSGGNDSPTRRADTYLSFQEIFYEYHVADLTPNYDFVAVKIGIQTLNTDFRGFIFNDTQLGVRLLGSQDNNHLQYNVALFDLREKDTNSELNTFDRRDQVVAVANLYRQDFLMKGYTTQVSLHGNFDHGARELYYDTNGGIVRPTPLGTVVPHDVDVGYLGWAGDGHFDRINISHALYYAFGKDELNGLAGRPVDVSAAMAALEVGFSHDWVRYKFSALYATGDSDPTDGTATGFDSIIDNTNFVGGPFSYFVRQGFNLGGTAVGMKQRFSVLPNLRTNKNQGQANFVNPGVFILGVGADVDFTPRVRGFFNLNHISFAQTEAIKTALFTNTVAHDLGWDLSFGVQWRPLLTDNIIVSAGYAVMLPGQGWEDIYRNTVPVIPGLSESPKPDPYLHSAVLAITLTY